MAWPDSSSIEQGWEDSVVASAPFSAQVCESSLSNPTAETGVHAMESAQDAGGPDGGSKFSTLRGKSRGASRRSQRSTVKASTTSAKQGGQKKKRMIAVMAGSILTALLVVAGIVTVAMVYKSKGGQQVASADTEAPGLPSTSSSPASSEEDAPADTNVTANTKKMSAPSLESKEKVEPGPKPNSKQMEKETIPVPSQKPTDKVEPDLQPNTRPNVTYDESIPIHFKKRLDWDPQAIQARKAQCAQEVAEAPHGEVIWFEGFPVREKRRLEKHTNRARQQEDLIFDAIHLDNLAQGDRGGMNLRYLDSFVEINKLWKDGSLRKLRFMTLNKLRLFGLNCHHDFPELLKTFNAVDKTPSNYDLDHEREIHVLPYVTELREALKNTKNADQLARQIIHIISNKTMPPKNAHTVETFTTLKNWLEDWNIEMLKRDVYELPANEEEYQKLKASK
eukprot:GHVT01060611.1.p1 GENE.GHVT01060611.1~~GHVT01060611.1.p1  ORF type:complete len:450 (+),score=58.96 GHVT01060611.1:830-2179(+)